MTWRQVCVFHTRGGRSPDPSDCPSPAAGVRRPGWPRATAAAFLLLLAGFRGRGGSDGNGKHVLTVYYSWFVVLGFSFCRHNLKAVRTSVAQNEYSHAF